MQVLVISERTLEPLFLLFFFLLLFVFVYLFFPCCFLKLVPRRSLALSADLISPPLYFLYGRSPILSSTHFPNPSAQRRAVSPVALPLQRVLALALLLFFYQSISPSTLLNQRPKGLDQLPTKLAPSVCS